MGVKSEACAKSVGEPPPAENLMKFFPRNAKYVIPAVTRGIPRGDSVHVARKERDSCVLDVKSSPRINIADSALELTLCEPRTSLTFSDPKDSFSGFCTRYWIHIVLGMVLAFFVTGIVWNLRHRSQARRLLPTASSNNTGDENSNNEAIEEPIIKNMFSGGCNTS